MSKDLDCSHSENAEDCFRGTWSGFTGGGITSRSDQSLFFLLKKDSNRFDATESDCMIVSNNEASARSKEDLDLPQADPIPPPKESKGRTNYSELLYSFEKKSEIPFFHDKLLEAGIDVKKPSTIKVAVLEPADSSWHPFQVAGVINDPEIGIFPGAIVHRTHLESKDLPPADPPKNLADFREYYAKRYGSAVRELTDHLKQFRGTDYRVINLSFGSCRAMMYEWMLSECAREPEKNRPLIEDMLGKEKAAEWIKQCSERNKNRGELDQGPPYSASAPHTKELFAKICRFCDDIIDGDSDYSNASKEYQNVVADLAKEGKVLIVAAGNFDGMLSEFGVKFPEGAYFNLFAQNDNVISVAAVDIGGTPGDRKDDFVDSYSSPGGGKYNPTLSAQGTEVPARYYPLWRVSGTSFATPMVTGTVALMLEQNPDLTPAEVKEILQSSASKIRGPVEKQGAGMINPDKAVQEAIRRRRK